ncbi:GntR family transcriptional regulator [Nakamurella lactea]|uniref:GntR family transcriptional regulator n=1 Tax=Nakamurella lactea TaxID=459515 RepID=UPI0003FFD724|nr:GntR family transcriptional regulator [Nakamurella lactea]
MSKLTAAASDDQAPDRSRLKSAAPRTSLGEVVADRVRDAILHGELRPSEHLREEELSELLEVSRGPVREAFLILQREGLVQVLRHRGARVVDLSLTDLGEVYSLRASIEDLAVRLATRRREESDLARLQGSFDAMEKLPKSKRTEHEAARMDVEFHDGIFAAARHERLWDSWSAIRMQVFLLLLKRNIANPDWRVITAEGHHRILERIRSGSEDAAAAEVRDHISTGYQRIVNGLVETAGKSTPEDDIRRLADTFLLP